MTGLRFGSLIFSLLVDENFRSFTSGESIDPATSQPTARRLFLSVLLQATEDAAAVGPQNLT